MFNNKGIKKAGLCVVTALVIMGTSGCNTKIKPNYGYNPTDHVELGQYKGIEYSVDEEGIEKDIINKRILSDQKDSITYQEITSRGAKEADKVTVDFSATINGLQVSGFSNNDYEIVLGTDTFVVDGFVDALYGMKAGEHKIVQLVVPEDFTQAAEYAGKKIVFEITMTKLEQATTPMITDAYVKENFGVDTVEQYKQKLKEEL